MSDVQYQPRAKQWCFEWLQKSHPVFKSYMSFLVVGRNEDDRRLTCYVQLVRPRTYSKVKSLLGDNCTNLGLNLRSAHETTQLISQMKYSFTYGKFEPMKKVSAPRQYQSDVYFRDSIKSLDTDIFIMDCVKRMDQDKAPPTAEEQALMHQLEVKNLIFFTLGFLSIFAALSRRLSSCCGGLFFLCCRLLCCRSFTWCRYLFSCWSLTWCCRFLLGCRSRGNCCSFLSVSLCFDRDV